jgi:hypothetical protein
MQSTVGFTDPAATSVSKVQHLVKAATNISKGQAVYITSADGTNMIISLASNVSELDSSKTLGLAAQNFVTNQQGYVITEGLLTGVNTSAANAAGDPVWLGQNGNLLFGSANQPYAPLHSVYIGVVTRKQQNNGEIFVHIQNGFEIREIHNVSAVNPATGDTLIYNAVTSLWESGSIRDEVGISYVPGIPASKTSTGQVGQLAIDGDNAVLYICTSTNNWQKVSLNAANFTNPGGFI